jgi:hypothetical protein
MNLPAIKLFFKIILKELKLLLCKRVDRTIRRLFTSFEVKGIVTRLMR